MSHVVKGFSTLGGGNQNSSWPCVSFWNGSAFSSVFFFSLALGSLYALIGSPLKTYAQVLTLWRSPELFATVSFLYNSLWYSVQPVLATLTSFNSKLFFLPGKTLDFISISSLCLVAWELSPCCKLRQW